MAVWSLTSAKRVKKERSNGSKLPKSQIFDDDDGSDTPDGGKENDLSDVSDVDP